MKRLILSTLSVLAFSSFATPAFANEVVAIDTINASKINQITPFNLVSGSYQGRFKSQGIPASGALTSAFNTNKINAEDLVRSAIASGRLTEATLDDAGYLSSVTALLRNLDSD